MLCGDVIQSPYFHSFPLLPFKLPILCLFTNLQDTFCLHTYITAVISLLLFFVDLLSLRSGWMVLVGYLIFRHVPTPKKIGFVNRLL